MLEILQKLCVTLKSPHFSIFLLTGFVHLNIKKEEREDDQAPGDNFPKISDKQ